jgi:hypothetical protein
MADGEPGAARVGQGVDLVAVEHEVDPVEHAGPPFARAIDGTPDSGPSRA